MPSSDVSGAAFCYVYVLESNIYPEQHYIGYTNDLRARVKEHNGGLNFSTKAYRPWYLIYYEKPALTKRMQFVENAILKQTRVIA